MAHPGLVVHPGGMRAWLLAVTLCSAFVFGWAGLVLPWRAAAPLGLLTWALAVLHLCTALALALRSEHSGRARFLLGVASLGAAPLFVVALASTSIQMVQRFAALGRGLALALGAIGWLSLLGTVPIGLYLIREARRLDVESGRAAGTIGVRPHEGP